MTDNLKTNWYLLGVEGGMMPTAQVEIVKREVEFLLPKMWRRVLVDGHFRPVPSLRLPSNYGFVVMLRETDDPEDIFLNEQAAAIEGLRGVRKVFTNATGRYSPVPKWEIQYLKDQEAEDYKEACKARPKFVEPKFSANTMVRVVRHERYSGFIGEFLYSVRGLATIAMPNGIKLPPIPDCDISPIAKVDAIRLAG